MLLLLKSPSGWDNESKINILMENSATLKSDSDYAEIITKPSIRKSMPGRELETILSTDDQEFLAKLQIILNKSTAPPTKSVIVNFYIIIIFSLNKICF